MRYFLRNFFTAVTLFCGFAMVAAAVASLTFAILYLTDKKESPTDWASNSIVVLGASLAAGALTLLFNKIRKEI